ncbi:hypothetical protein TWF694_009019 [Orbilia ellipsospora]|uniref:carnosine N-methyltransferase n=1 Tax=Orbilia ellipsospora TaxID=2528407 RepID=A0AAV9XDL7_9PEZI
MAESEHHNDHTHEHGHDHAHEKGPLQPSCDDEQKVLRGTLASFYLYRRAAHFTFTHRRRRNFYSLPLAHQEVLKSISYQSTLDKIDDCIERNAHFAEALLLSGGESFGMDIRGIDKWKETADQNDMDKARSTMKQFLRDWSKDGERERAETYDPILEAIHRLFGEIKPRCDVRFLIPGAGLGRLAFEICRRGYKVEGNEVSYHQLIASNFVLNNTMKADEYVLHPFCLGFSHHRSRENQLRAITIPDVHPATELNRVLEFVAPEGGHRAPGMYRYQPSQYFSMSAGEFVESYNNPESAETFDCVVTCFFIDTARNLMDYLETIRNILAPNGIWINHGPLLWHWEGADATAAQDPDGKKKGGKSLETAEGDAEDAETLQLPPNNTKSAFLQSLTHSHTHGADSGTHTHSHFEFESQAGSSSQTQTQPTSGLAGGHSHASPNGPEWRGSLEFTLDEVLALAKLYGFNIVEQKTGKVGYIEDEKCMGKYIYEPEFWIAVKTENVSDVVKASFRKYDEDTDTENEGGDGGEGSSGPGRPDMRAHVDDFQEAAGYYK